MNPTLALSLLSTGVICQGTVIEAYRQVRSLSCQCDSKVIAAFVVHRARLSGDRRVIFDTIDSQHAAYAVQAEQVVTVDGMRIERLADAQNLALDGSQLARRTRRGRQKNAATGRRDMT